MLREFSEDLVMAMRINFPLQIRYVQKTKANNLIMSYVCISSSCCPTATFYFLKKSLSRAVLTWNEFCNSYVSTSLCCRMGTLNLYILMLEITINLVVLWEHQETKGKACHLSLFLCCEVCMI